MNETDLDLRATRLRRGFCHTWEIFDMLQVAIQPAVERLNSTVQYVDIRSADDSKLL